MIDAETYFSHIFAIAIKASSIAQAIRYEPSLFNLLVQNKDATDFVSLDYKTFADVLIQETARYDLTNLHPDMGKNLFGEENNSFTNRLNVSVNVTICDSIELTKQMILKIVDNHEELAEKLSHIIHKNIEDYIENDFLDKLKILSGRFISIENIQMWIDPIDCTQQYIDGNGWAGQDLNDSIKNTTVLIGVYDKTTGIPMAGVICQPFHQINPNGLWTHSCYWGLCFEDIALYSNNIFKRVFSMPGRIITSYKEVENLSSNLNRNKSINWNVIGRYGAGFKLLSLLTSNMDCCIVPQGSTYKWDTCGPHGILLSIGGGLLDYEKIISISKAEIKNINTEKDTNQFIELILSSCQVRYNTTQADCNNAGGFIAYTDRNVLISVLKSLLDI